MTQRKLLISYDLYKVGQNYTCLTDRLRALGAVRIQQSVWLLKSNYTTAQIRDHLVACLDSNDKLMVAALTGEAAWVGYSANDNPTIRRQLTA